MTLMRTNARCDMFLFVWREWNLDAPRGEGRGEDQDKRRWSCCGSQICPLPCKAKPQIDSFARPVPGSSIAVESLAGLFVSRFTTNLFALSFHVLFLAHKSNRSFARIMTAEIVLL